MHQIHPLIASQPVHLDASFRPNPHATGQWHDVPAAPSNAGNLGDDVPIHYETNDSSHGIATMPSHDRVLHDLLNQASQSGYALTHVSLGQNALSGGNTTETVGVIRMTAPFVFKIDTKQVALADEAATIKAIRCDHRIAKSYRDAWPIVYGLRREPPYAYLMECFPRESGWQSLEHLLYSEPNVTDDQAASILQPVLDVMEAGFHTSVCRRHHPSVWETYITRIQDRLEQAERLHPWFHGGERIINGNIYPGWRDCLQTLTCHREGLQHRTPGFTTVVHGDPNPGNILLRHAEDESWQIKLIDPKAWGVGDYLFDLAKLAHFFIGTGPVEHLGATHALDEGNHFSYQLPSISWQHHAFNLCRATAQRIAADHGDHNWAFRFELAIAANLLGLPASRIAKGRISHAKILFAEGISLLDALGHKFIQSNSVDFPLRYIGREF